MVAAHLKASLPLKTIPLHLTVGSLSICNAHNRSLVEVICRSLKSNTMNLKLRCSRI